MSAWTDLVKKIYNENKGKDGYKLGDAMKEAKKHYKTNPVVVESKPTKKRRGKARKTRKIKK